jgi:hypothetical protein
MDVPAAAARMRVANHRRLNGLQEPLAGRS